MTKFFRFAVLAVFLFVTPGCVCSAVKTQAGVTSKEHDTYAQLVTQTLDGTLPEADGKPVTKEDLAATPPSVKAFLQNLINAVFLSRKGWHQLNYAINDGPDPKTLDLENIPVLPE